MAPKILVVEDEPSIHELISINLEMAGYRVIGAESAERATSLIRDELPPASIEAAHEPLAAPASDLPSSSMS